MEYIQNEIEKEKSELEKKAIELYKKSHKVIAIFKDGTKRKVRLGISENDNMLIMKSKNYGIKIDEAGIIDIKEIDYQKEWYNSIDKAINILEKSGLWRDVLENLKIAKSVGYEKLQKAYEITNCDFIDKQEKALIDLASIFKQNGISLNELENSNLIDKDKIIYYYKNNTNEYDLNEKIIIEKIKEIDNRLIEVFNDKERYKTEILFHFVEPLTIKKMRFDNDKRMNEFKLNQIKEAIQNKQEIEIYGRTSYDVRFHYKPNENKAFYSEEFRGKGNGHYYIALNEKYALFMEDD